MKILLTIMLAFAVAPFSAMAQKAVAPYPAMAPKCKHTVVEGFEISTSVVAAEAISVKTKFEGHPLDRTKPREIQIVTWQVLENWKGSQNPTDIFETHTVINIVNEDGMSVYENEAYILYQMDPSWVSNCSRSSVLKHAIRDIPILYDLKVQFQAGT